MRWINLGLAILLATLLGLELTRSMRPEAPAVQAISAAPPVVVRETPARRSRREQARMAFEEARRRQRERSRVPAGSIPLGEDGLPFVD